MLRTVFVEQEVHDSHALAQLDVAIDNIRDPAQQATHRLNAES